MKITRLEIKTSNLQEQLKFYRDLLGLNICAHSENSFEVEIGYSVLKFSAATRYSPYHIAFHIPDKQEEIALSWIKARVSVLKNNKEEIIDFSNWQAKSVYFYDRDKNIMEFISRKNFSHPKKAIFSEESILGIAEIGLATSEIEPVYHQFQKVSGLEVYDGNFDKFCAIGDDEGLIITVDKNSKTWFPTRDKAKPSEFTFKFIKENISYNFKYSDGKLQNLN